MNYFGHEEGIPLEQLIKLCSYNTHIKVLRADTGKLIIDGACELSNSKDKRQKAKWEALRGVNVFGIKPCVEASKLKYSSHAVWLTIEAYMYANEYEQAMKGIES